MLNLIQLGQEPSVYVTSSLWAECGSKSGSQNDSKVTAVYKYMYIKSRFYIILLQNDVLGSLPCNLLFNKKNYIPLFAFLQNVAETEIKRHRCATVFLRIQTEDGVYIYTSHKMLEVKKSGNHPGGTKEKSWENELRPVLHVADLFLRPHAPHSFYLPQSQPAGVAACQQTAPSTQKNSYTKNPYQSN